MLVHSMIQWANPKQLYASDIERIQLWLQVIVRTCEPEKSIPGPSQGNQGGHLLNLVREWSIPILKHMACLISI